MAAKRGPRPRPGVLDIAPYVPGTSALPGAHPVIKLSSNETPFGPSPRAVEAYHAAAANLSRYPDGWELRKSPVELVSPDGRVVARAGDEVTVRGAEADMASICQIGPIIQATEVVLAG